MLSIVPGYPTFSVVEIAQMPEKLGHDLCSDRIATELNGHCRLIGDPECLDFLIIVFETVFLTVAVLEIFNVFHCENMSHDRKHGHVTRWGQNRHVHFVGDR